MKPITPRENKNNPPKINGKTINPKNIRNNPKTDNSIKYAIANIPFSNKSNKTISLPHNFSKK